METAEFGTNTNPNTTNNLLLINSKIKKNPHNITIKNYNPNEPKQNNPRFYILINKIIANIKPTLNQNY